MKLSKNMIFILIQRFLHTILPGPMTVAKPKHTITNTSTPLMYTNKLSLLKKVILERNDARDEILLVLDDMQMRFKDLSYYLECIGGSFVLGKGPGVVFKLK